MENEVKGKDWYPKSLTGTFLGIILAVLTGIVINHLTGSITTNQCFFIISIVSIGLFILCLIASLKLLIIRNKVDDLFFNKTYDNEKTDPKQKVSPMILWEKTLSELYKKQITKFRCWKWIGIISLALGVVLMIYVNVESRTDNIKHENRIYENSSAIMDSLDHLNRKLDQQNVLILQLTDSIQSVKKEIRISKDINVEKEKTTNR